MNLSSSENKVQCTPKLQIITGLADELRSIQTVRITFRYKIVFVSVS